ncbi:DNA modification methyltransferase [Minicystis rosea]|nr:DNA modification methyltransferase [Minicystis rosea]
MRFRSQSAPSRREGSAVPGKIEVFTGDNLPILAGFPDASFDLVYIDPPFNTGRAQARTRIRTERHAEGDRVGFQGRRYRTTVVGQSSFRDRFDDYLRFLAPRLEEAHRLLKPEGSFFLHLDYREVHYAKVLLDEIFGRDSFINELIWAYDYGARATKRWSPKHDNILFYAKDPRRYCFNFDEIDRIPYMAPGLVGKEKAARGKTPTDTWWHTIVSPNGKEKTGYPTQKPLGVLSRIVRVHSRPGDRLLDFFAGSGSFGDAGARHGRDVVLIDESPQAIEVMRRRFAGRDALFRDAPPPVHTAPDRAKAAGSEADTNEAPSNAKPQKRTKPKTMTDENGKKLRASKKRRSSGKRAASAATTATKATSARASTRSATKSRAPKQKQKPKPKHKKAPAKTSSRRRGPTSRHP